MRNVFLLSERYFFEICVIILSNRRELVALINAHEAICTHVFTFRNELFKTASYFIQIHYQTTTQCITATQTLSPTTFEDAKHFASTRQLRTLPSGKLHTKSQGKRHRA